MKIIADVATFSRNNFNIEIVHKNEVLYFSFPAYNKGHFSEGNEVFLHINRYWEQQTEYFQDTVFGIYKDIYENFEDVLSKETLAARLTQSVKELFDLHKFENMKNWLVRSSGVVPPNSFEERYQEDVDRNTTLDKTYLRGDYWELMTLCLMLRMMVPVWSKYTRHIKNHSGVHLKELESFNLLLLTEIPHLRPIEKLLCYIKANMRKDLMNVPVTLMSEEDVPYWVMVSICVRKLGTGDFRTTNDSANLVTLIHNHITSPASFENDFSKTVKSKDAGDAGTEENKISTMESFRVLMDISVAETVEIPYSVRDEMNVIRSVCMDLPLDLYQECQSTIRVISDMAMPKELGAERRDISILRPQKVLTCLVLKNAIAPSGFDYLDMELQVRCMGLAQAVLWYHDFKYLSLLCSAVSPMIEGHRPAIAPTKERVPVALQQELRSVFRHVRVIQNRKAEAREECEVTLDIEKLTDDFHRFVWQPTANHRMIQEVLGPDASIRRIPILPDIRIQLTRLMIAVGRDQFAQPKSQ